MIALVDYGAGNAVNVKNAFSRLGTPTVISRDSSVWEAADAVVFPGVGSFGATMENLGKDTERLKAIILSGKPFLGICLGMQILMEDSEESLGAPGLEIIRGSVRKLVIELPVPHVGWNKLEEADSILFDGLSCPYAYFAHSYYCDSKDKGLVSSTTRYGVPFASSFQDGSLFATQFHPEKSGEAGLTMLRNFVDEVKK
jgi:glutamine amidotransferase